MSVKDAMSGYFERLLLATRNSGMEWPVTSWDEDVEPIVYVGEPDEDEMIAWQPVERNEDSDLEEIEAIHGGPVRADLREYFNSYWFCAMGGRLGNVALEMEPVLPGSELESVTRNYAGYVAAHDGETRFIPIGVETGQSQLVVIDNDSGEVFLEDFEIGRRTQIASALETLIAGMQV